MLLTNPLSSSVEGFAHFFLGTDPSIIPSRDANNVILPCSQCIVENVLGVFPSSQGPGQLNSAHGAEALSFLVCDGHTFATGIPSKRVLRPADVSNNVPCCLENVSDVKREFHFDFLYEILALAVIG